MSQAAFRLRVYGNPMPQERVRMGTSKFGRRVFYDAEKSKAWKESVVAHALMRGRPTLLTGDLEMTLVFYLPRKKSVRRKRPGVKPDNKNLLWGVEDALEGIVYKNDSQIVDHHVRKRYSDQPGVAIVVRQLEEVEE